MSEQGSQMLAIAGASLAAVIFALCLMRFMRIDGARSRNVYRVVFSGLAALLAPTLIVAGHGVLPVPFIACIPVLAFNLTSISELELGALGLLAIGAGKGTGEMWVFTLPTLLVFALMMALPWSRAKPRRSGASE